jgi:hypothetical protein
MRVPGDLGMETLPTRANHGESGDQKKKAGWLNGIQLFQKCLTHENSFGNIIGG